MLTIVLLIRHGETDWNSVGRWQGHTDIPLNENGIRQARLLAERLVSWPVTAIYTSDLKRAAKTATILGETLNLKPVADVSLRERNGGQFQGLTANELQTHHAEQLQRFRNGAAPPGGEANLDVANRITTIFERLVTQHKGQMIVMVSHGGAMNVLIGHLLGLPQSQSAPINLNGNTGLTIVEIDENGPRLTLLNDTCHLTDHDKQKSVAFSLQDPPESQ